MNQFSRIIVIVALSFQTVLSFGQAPLDTLDQNLLEQAAELAEEVLDLVTWEKGRHTVSVYPMAGYSPRTGYEIGIMPVWRIKPAGEVKSNYHRPTTIAPAFQMSSKGMYEVQLDAVVFTKRQWFFISRMQYLFLPDTFFGLGNQEKEKPYSEYELNRFSLNADMLKGWNERWFVGLRTDFNQVENNDIQGDLLNPAVLGYAGGWANGLGPTLAFDTRNDLLYPSSGWFAVASALWFDDWMGSDYRFQLSSLDVRKYIPVKGDESILGLQAYFSHSDGDVPFFKLPYIGGKRMLRGIPHPHKYLDKNAWFAQAEWRQNIWWRIGAVAFAGTGKVFPTINEGLFNDLHVVGGAGLRFRVLPDEGLNFRIDYGISNHGESGMYFTIREAF